MNAFTRVDVISDTPEWEAERRNSVGASEVAAIMGLSKWATALDVYKSKQGVDKPFDPILGFIGHESEHIIHKWVEQWSGTGAIMQPGFMARSTTHPFIHASFDRVSNDPFLTWQFKTAHQHAGHKWDEGIPTDIRVQVQTEMFVAGTERAAVVVWIGGREFRLFWEARDESFLNEFLLPAVSEFWTNLQNGVAPEPSTLAEVSEVFPSKPDSPIEATDEIRDLLGQYVLANSDAKMATEEAANAKLHIAKFMREHDTLTFRGKKVASFKTQSGRKSFDTAALEVEHPEIYASFVRQGADFKVLRTVKGALDD